MAKRRHRKKSLPVRLGEVPTVERCHQMDGTIVEVIDRDPGGRAHMLRHKARVECMLDAYLNRELIERAAHEAGMKYRVAWLRARQGIKVSDPYTTGGAVNYEASVMMVYESERLLKQADAALTLPQKSMVIRVCGDDKMAGGTDKIETLHRGLDKLVKLWGIR